LFERSAVELNGERLVEYGERVGIVILAVKERPARVELLNEMGAARRGSVLVGARITGLDAIAGGRRGLGYTQVLAAVKCGARSRLGSNDKCVVALNCIEFVGGCRDGGGEEYGDGAG